MASLTSLIKQTEFHGIRKYLSVSVPPKEIICEPGKVGRIRFQDGTICNSSCLGCKERPCMKYTENEISLPDRNILFLVDNENSVCPTRAITWNEDNNCPSILHSECIKCGLCVARCPVKALYISSRIEVENSPNEYLISTCNKNFEEKIESTYSVLSALSTSGRIQNESDCSISEVYRRITLLPNIDQQFPNRLARNLLFALGIKAYMRRKGDVYSRTDLIFYASKYQGVCEVEFSDLLDSPRDILDDMAVFIARYKVNMENILPLIIGFSLPNGRSEYWEVINDIYKVLHFKIYTITIGALILLIWNCRKINLCTEQFPYADSENCSIRPGINLLLQHNAMLSVACNNILEPIKSSR